MKKNEFQNIIYNKLFILQRLKFHLLKAQEVTYKENPLDFFGLSCSSRNFLNA